MALLADEQFSGGQVRDINGRTVVTTGTLNAALSGGERLSGGRVRDADGRMVVVTETASATLTAGEQWCDGEVRDSAGRLVVVVDALNAVLPAGERYSGGHVRDQAGRRVIASDTGAVTLLAGEQLSGGQVRDSAGRMVVRGATAGLSYSATVLATPGLVSYWKLDEVSGTVAADANGLNAGTYSAGTTLAQTGLLANVADKSVKFTGTGSMSSTAFSLGTTFSVEVWFQPTAADIAAANPMIVTKSGATTHNNFPGPFDIYLQVGVPLCTIGDAVGASGGWVGPAALTAGVTYHMVWTCGGATPPLLYLNGASIAVTLTWGQATPGIVDAGQPVYVGARADGVSSIVGLIDEVSVYNVVLSPAQALAHYNAGLSGL